jgi:hypothetical protein
MVRLHLTIPKLVTQLWDSGYFTEKNKEKMLQQLRTHWSIPSLSISVAIATLTLGLPLKGEAQTRAAQTSAISLNAKSKTTIVLPQSATLPERTAASELDDYLTRITGGDFVVQAENVGGQHRAAIYVGTTQFAKRAGLDGRALPSEQWHIKTQNGNLVVVGGGVRGTLYATYHFLEDVCGVHWWNPFEETVPGPKALSIPALNKQGKPAFAERDINSSYDPAKERFAVRSRLNEIGDGEIPAEYGGSTTFGPPGFVHTFFEPIYMDPAKYYAAHPDWYVYEGKETPGPYTAQLALSHPEMRKEFLRLLQENIRTSRQAAIAKGAPFPKIYDVSQNDIRVSFVRPEDQALVAANGGAESAVLLDFINYLADGIKDEFPDVYISTLAYQRSEKPPTAIKARDNVIITLCDTHGNVLQPITAGRNFDMRENLQAWSKISKNVRVWDYNILYGLSSLPAPTIQTYAVDMQFYLKHNVRGLFVELEDPLIADMRDMKFWMLCKLMENPNQDYNALVKVFTDGYYGAAGSHVRRYLTALQAEADSKKADVFASPNLPDFTYLNLDFLQKADRIYAEAADLVKDDPVLSQRVLNARFSVDDAILRLFSNLTQEWVDAGHTPDTMPLRRDASAQRMRRRWEEQMQMRPIGRNPAEELQRGLAAVDQLFASAVYAPRPAKFKDIPPANLFVYNAQGMTNATFESKLIADPTAESGFAARLLLDELRKESDREAYKLPMPWGAYDSIGFKALLWNQIKAEDIPGPGYHWYKMGETSLTGHDYVYLFWSWIIQNGVNDAFDAKNSDAKFEVWVNLKFEGPMFPHGNPGDKDAISAERIVLVKK